MGTGLSISSINRIKELAEEKKYAEALEILETQNLDKSINPQFLRISGEIFRENKRYYDSRKYLLKSHQMSPQGTRIIFELIKLHLELGHYSLAERYYEEYQFYASAEDVQKDYVEYCMKKATGAEVKELASILVPILERMPEDQWNFEAVLLYDKLGRKDKALEECQYILENFKDSVYIQPVIEYIDDTLDVDRYFDVYPAKEQEDDAGIFGDLIGQEEKLLETDHLRMYPPEARIMVDVEDRDPVDVKPVKDKEKKDKEKKKRKKQKHSDENIEEQEEAGETQSAGKSEGGGLTDRVEDSAKSQELSEEQKKQEEQEELQKERERALDQLLSKKLDREKLRESAKQMARTVKEIHAEKAKQQVKTVAETVKDNVKKATDVLGEAVGVTASLEEKQQISETGLSDVKPEDVIMDGIIEEVLEEPKPTVGKVVVNEELDTLIPDSLEAMSPEEAAEVRRKEEEARRLAEELERQRLEKEREEQERKEREQIEKQQAEEAEREKERLAREEAVRQAEAAVEAEKAAYEELKTKYFEEQSSLEQKPLDSLGFISVVQSDVDSELEEKAPDIANMLRQMIDNKEYYTGEDSSGFESKPSYENHGFVVEDFDFEIYKDETDADMPIHSVQMKENKEEPRDEKVPVEVIFAEKAVMDFSEIVPQEPEQNEFGSEHVVDQGVSSPEKQPDGIAGQESGMVQEELSSEKQSEDIGGQEPDAVRKELPAERQSGGTDEQEHEIIQEGLSDQTKRERSVGPEHTVRGAVDRVMERRILEREKLRVRIMLSEDMVNKLLELKESR